MSEPSGGNVHFAHVASEAQRDHALAFVRAWRLDPPEAGGRLSVAATAPGGDTAWGGMREAAVRALIEDAALQATLIAAPRSDQRFEGTLPAGGYCGVPVAHEGARFGWIEAHADGPISLAVAADLERRANALAAILASARLTAEEESPARGTVVVCDDDPGIRSLLKLLLVRRGFEVTDVNNGLVALETCRRTLPDLLLIDWVMPIMDGRETVEKLKRDPLTRGIPVVMLTSQSQIDDKVAALEAGAQDFLTKPFDSRELVARVEQQMRWRRLLADVPPDAADEKPEAPVASPPAAPAPPVEPSATASASASAASEAAPADAARFAGDVWSKAVEAAQLGKHREALALYLQEAERCEAGKQYARAAIAFRSASLEAGYLQNPNLTNKLLRLAGKMYLTWSETAHEAKAIQDGYLNAARCFLTAGNLQLAKKSIDYAHSYDAVIADNAPPTLG